LLERVGPPVENAAMDAIGMEPSTARAHNRTRAGKARKAYLKVSVIVMCDCLLLAGLVISCGPTNDKADAAELLELARAKVQPKRLLADAGYDAEWVHEFCYGSGGWVYGQQLSVSDPLYRQATTACLGAIFLLQAVNVFLCRGQRASAFSFGLLSNPLILAGILTEIVLLVLIAYTPLGNQLFGTAPVAGWAWLFLVPFATGLLALEELRKWLTRRWASRTGGQARPMANSSSRAAVRARSAR
jgi:magnesium-transporting ATPase (P-type)